MNYIVSIIAPSALIALFSLTGCITPNNEGGGDASSIQLFNGKDLSEWKPIDFGGQGEVSVTDGNLVLGSGEMMTGVVYTAEEPPARMNYEISLEAKRMRGDDIFCGLTFPVGTNCVSLIIGGWGGVVCGISSVNYMDASENETTAVVKFEKDQWYAIKVRVTPGKINFWLDGEELIDLETTDKKLAVRPGDIELCQPLGMCSWQTEGVIRNIQLTKLPAGN
ncbi:MAG: hypothetical protein ACI9TH_003008 [Kiritimatiellia bacterium]|jgi:hypothetical protein